MSFEKEKTLKEKYEERTLEEWLKEIEAIREAEMNKKEAGKRYDPHFDLINTKQLRSEDIEWYKKFRLMEIDPESVINDEEFKKYQETIWASSADEKLKDYYDSRTNFVMYLVNKFMPMEVRSDKKRTQEWKDKGGD